MMIVHLIMASMIFSTMQAEGPNYDNCDWTGSGTLAMALSREVQPVYLRCNQGTVRWHYPQGALRIVLQHRSASSAFSACLRRSKATSGARIYLAGRKTLHLMFDSNDPMDLVKCVSSHGGQVALYVEADPVADVLRKATAEFSYHLKRMAKRFDDEILDECQPCTEDQILRHFCSSDFVVQGTVTNLFHNKALQRTELTVCVSQVYRTNRELFGFSEETSNLPEYLPGQTKYVVFHRPLRCGTKSGSGEYLFLGKWLLGNPSLNCVPRLSEWKKVRRKALLTGSNECLLNL